MREALAVWNRFWFEPISTSTMALIRIAVGLVSLGWAISLAPDLFEFLGSRGMLPIQPKDGEVAGPWHTWGLLGIFHGNSVLLALYVALVAGSVLLTVGCFTRVAAVAVFLGLLSLQRKNPFVFNSGDALLRDVSFYVMLAPAGAALSVDRWWRARGRFWEFPLRSAWPVRLLQIQLCIVYFFAVWGKVRGTTWNDGTAVSYAVRLTDLVRLPVPAFMSDSLLISNFFTYGTLAVELALAILVWNRKLRPWILLSGLGLHLGIEYAMRVGFYSFAVTIPYLAFLPATATAARLITLRNRFLPAGAAPRGRGAGETAASEQPSVPAARES